jgi:hypothetical protein
MNPKTVLVGPAINAPFIDARCSLTLKFKAVHSSIASGLLLIPPVLEVAEILNFSTTFAPPSAPSTYKQDDESQEIFGDGSICL